LTACPQVGGTELFQDVHKYSPVEAVQHPRRQGLWGCGNLKSHNFILLWIRLKTVYIQQNTMYSSW